MTTAQPARNRALIGGISAAALIALFVACGSSEVTAQREGGGVVPAVPQEDVGGGALSDAPVPWCAAYQIINCTCQQCHLNPPVHGAPIPLLTYADTQAPLPANSKTKKVWQTMQAFVSNRFMPYTADKTVMPTVLPLSDDDYNTLLSWFAQGATDFGGQDCPTTCDWTKGPPPGR